MKIAVLGTGAVGQQLGSALIALGHSVRMGSRTPDNAEAAEWVARSGERASQGTFEDAAEWSEIALNCTGGPHSLAVVARCADELVDKVLIDVSNPLDFSQGFPPFLSVANTDSLGEQIQRRLPKTRVVKALNTVANELMVAPHKVPGEHVLLICGDDDGAKEVVRGLLGELGWTPGQIVDLGGIDNARATEAWLLIWTRLYGKLGTGLFNIEIKRGKG